MIIEILPNIGFLNMFKKGGLLDNPKATLATFASNNVSNATKSRTGVRSGTESRDASMASRGEPEVKTKFKKRNVAATTTNVESRTEVEMDTRNEGSEPDPDE
eukprot:TRINITY_DN3215_c0_g2_i2.p1 TRINITY_DN3215_c0_g2~~TRINITY_DN3215_c0_g2_i2.p1  ORF type:complete len:103 (-),score=26.75 TRINITY_DN3215_c0_g2_i2:109-417(-)